MSQGALAKKARLTPSEISRIECGYRDLSRDEAVAIAKALKVPVNEIADTPRDALPSATAMALAQQPATVPASALAPVGDDLRDPANFTKLPDLALLQPKNLAPDVFRMRLAADIAGANVILHTPKVPAAIWRAWREFEKRANELLRGVPTDHGSERSAPVTNPILGEPPMTRLPAGGFRISGSSKFRHQQKSFNALFVETARRLLPSDVATKVTGVAEARVQRDRSIGFMKNFRDVAYELLPAVELNRIIERIRTSESDRARRGCL